MAKLYKHKKLTSILSCLLIVVLVFNICTVPAKAEVITLTVGAVAAVVALLGLMGITFATAGLAQKAAENFITANTDIWDDINSITVDGTGSGGDGGENPDPRTSLAINAATLALGQKILNRLKEWFNREDGVSDIPEGQDTSGVYLSLHHVDSDGRYWYLLHNLSFSDTPDKHILSGDGFYTITSNSYGYSSNSVISLQYSVLAPFNYSKEEFYCIIHSSSNSNLRFSLDGSLRVRDSVFPYFPIEFNGSRFSTSPLSDGTIGTTHEIGFYFPTYGQHVSFSSYIVLTPLVDTSLDIPYYNANSYTSNQITNYFGDIINQGGTVTIPLDDIATQIEAGSATELNNSIDDLIDSIDGLRDAINNSGSEPTPSVPDTSPWDDIDSDDFNMPSLKLVFPFCVPFDLIDLVQTLNARAEAPVFTIPVNFDFVDYQDEIVLDLSEWESAAKVVRWGSTISFMLALILISRKMIRG